MSTDNNTTNIPDPRFAGALQISFRGRFGESNTEAFARFSTALFNAAHKSTRGPVVLRVHDWDHLNEMIRELIELMIECPERAFRLLVARWLEDDYLRMASNAMDVIVYENVAVHITDGDNPRWIVLANLVG